MFFLLAIILIVIVFSGWRLYRTRKHEKELADRERYWKQRDRELRDNRDVERK